MLFKNLRLYRLPRPWSMTLGELESSLERLPFQPCGSFDMKTRGWVAPHDDGCLVYSQGGHWLLCLQTEEKIIPASLLKQEVEKKASEFLVRNGYTPGRNTKKEIKEDVTNYLLQKALCKQKKTHVWIDAKGGWLGIDTASATQVDCVFEALFDSVTGFDVRHVNTLADPSDAMADWLIGDNEPQGFSIEQDCELQDYNGGNAIVRYVHHPLYAETYQEIYRHLSDGKQVTKLALTWNSRISFVLTKHLEIKRIEFSDVLREKFKQDSPEEANELFAAEFSLMSGEFSRFVPDLVEALGGEVSRPDFG